PFSTIEATVFEKRQCCGNHNLCSVAKRFFVYVETRMVIRIHGSSLRVGGTREEVHRGYTFCEEGEVLRGHIRSHREHACLGEEVMSRVDDQRVHARVVLNGGGAG